VLIDNQLSLRQHINKVSSSCFFHLRRLRQISRAVGQTVTTQLIVAFVQSRLDYCNAVLGGLSQSAIAPLQRVQNSAARLALGLRPRDSVTSALIELHWLPVYWRVLFKLCLLMHQIHHGRSPVYLSEKVTSVASGSSRPGLRSAGGTDYIKPRLRTKIGERAFSSCGPAAWNALPEKIRCVKDIKSFKTQLKTHYFKLAFE